jgi:hypothetical protein
MPSSHKQQGRNANGNQEPNPNRILNPEKGASIKQNVS